MLVPTTKDKSQTHAQARAQSQAIRSSSSCAACKLLKRRCSPACIFAPYFRADEPKKFAQVHKVFGASNISKIISEVPEEHREDAVKSLIFEAEARLRDPVYGCLGPIAILHHRMVELQQDLAQARDCLARYTAHYTSPSSSSTSTCPYYDATTTSMSSIEAPDDHFYWYYGNNDGNGLSYEHIPMSLGQVEGAQLGSIGGSNNTNIIGTANFGQVSLLPL